MTSEPNPLVPVEMLELSRPELLRRLRELKLPYVFDITADDGAARALTYSLLFERWPELAGVELDAARRFYNRYFWFLRYISLYQKTHGFDASLEDAADHMAEEVEREPFHPDWDLLEEIYQRARQLQGSAVKTGGAGKTLVGRRSVGRSR